VPPPAISGIDNTVSVTFALADSFDVLPDGTCAGRSANSGMRDGARVQLRSDIVGGSVWGTATARFERRPPQTYNGVKGRWLDDDGLYCTVTTVFAATNPDPQNSYSIKFAGSDWRGVRILSRFWMYEHMEKPGYGSTSIGVQTCGSLADPPDKDC